MKRFLRASAGIYLLLMFALFMTGCINIEMKVNSNGSCDLKYEIKTEGMVGLSEVEKQFKESIDEANKLAGKRVAKLKNIKEKDGTITANISVNNVSHLDDDAYFGKLADFRKDRPNELGSLYEVKTGDPVSDDKIKGAGGLNVVVVSGMDSDGTLSNFTVILPGKVKYTSSNVSPIDDKSVTISGGNGVILYQRSGGAGWLLYVVAIVIIVVVVLIVLKGKGKAGKGAKAAAAPIPAVPVAPVAPAAPAAPAAPMPTAPAAPADSGDMIRCPNCNAVQKGAAKFCSSCGGKIEGQ